GHLPSSGRRLPGLPVGISCSRHWAFSHWHLAAGKLESPKIPTAKCYMPCARYFLPLRLSARQFLHFALLRTTRVVPRLFGLFSSRLFAGGAFGFLTFFFAEFRCVCHECCSRLLKDPTNS